MNQDMVIDIARDALLLIIYVSAPVLLLALIVGLVVSIFQTVTSIQEQTLAFVPKILAVFIGLLLFGSWMLTKIVSFTVTLYNNFSTYILG